MTLLFLLWSVLLYERGDSHPVTPMSMSPEELASSLRNAAPTMPQKDCRALNLWECVAGAATRVRDISLRFVQLDDDPELEAILVTEARAERTHMAYAFDRHGAAWNMVGAFSCNRRPCNVESLVRVEKLTADSPPLLLYYSDVGGSGSMIMLTTGFLLRQGKLEQVWDFVNCSASLFPVETERRQFAFANNRHLVVHTIEQQKGRPEHHACLVWRWDSQYRRFCEDSKELGQFCDPKTGRPIPGRSYPTELNACPGK